MQIKTKYNIGDKVWRFVPNKGPECFPITKILITVTQDNIVCIHYQKDTDWGSTSYDETKLYPSKEDLMDAVINLFKTSN